MTTITDHYAIAEPVAFLNVNVGVDNRMFVDPHAIRLQDPRARWVKDANHLTETFFLEVAMSALSGDSKRGLQLLQHFEEPWETRLGLARGGFRGHGGAAEVGAWIWDALTTDLEALLRIGMLRQIEDLPLFVNGIDRDITSDVTTRIVFAALAGLAQHPEFTAGTHRVESFERQVWDSEMREWTYQLVDLPIADGKPLLLVPKHWARPRLLMSAGRYYETSVLSYAQLEQAVTLKTGKLLTISKDNLKSQSALGRGRVTNLRVTRRAHATEEDLLGQFRTFVDSRYKPLDERASVIRIA